MIFKITMKRSLLILSLGCSRTESFHRLSKYETVYSRTINKEKFKLIYQILERKSLMHFPSKKKE